MTDPEPGDAPASLDAIGDGLRDARPEHQDVPAALARARVAEALFGRRDPVRIGRYTIEAQVGAGGGGEVFVAHDPALSRRVAIKLLRAVGDRERLLREGQALARLSHPNVVPVYDAGTVDDRVYVVMELVEGDTLRAYCEVATRTVRDIVRAYRQAGEGLAAAHRAGFIHRDFKPDNAVIGRDGRVRVVDFGLARDGDEPEPQSDAVADAAGDTPPGTTQVRPGTPRYMAPEQARGGALTAAADQYAFCLSLREGVIARGPALPRWLDPILRRGLADAAGDRYPSMDALVAALGRDPAWRWRRRAVVAGALGLAAAAFVVGRTNRAAAPACDSGAAELVAAWSEEPAARVAAHLDALSPYARGAAAQVAGMFERYAGAWRAGHREACVAHRDGAQSTELFNHRVACLARARAALGTAVTVIASASAREIASVIAAVGELPDLERCGDPSTLLDSVAPPPPSIAAAVAEAGNELASLEVEVRAARPDVRPRIEAVVRRAAGLGYGPLRARALRLAGRAAIAVDQRAAAIPPFREATTLALTAGDWPLAVESFAIQLWAASTAGQDGAFAGLELVQSIAEGLPASARWVRALLDNCIGGAEQAAGHRDRARAAFERALALVRGVTGPAALELASIRSNLALVIDDPARSKALAQERIAIVEAGLGNQHPITLDARIAAAWLELDPRRARAGLEPACYLLSELHPDHGPDIRTCQSELGWLALERGDAAAARIAFGRVVAPAGADDTVAAVAIARAELDALDGRPAAAGPALDTALAALGSLAHPAWYVRLDAANALLARGALAVSAGRDAAARADLEAARDHLEAAIAVSPMVSSARRLAFARTSLVRSWRGAPLPAAARRDADAAIAWYREAGGYDDAIAELERARAR